MTPRFAVVGHPNKGKSSIVATLARDDRVAISMQSGTTVVSESFEVAVGAEHYELIDTPGFQRPRKVLAWLKARAGSADQRAAAVRDFVRDADCQAQFADEVELLRPIVNGAGILYVVDGSRPYGAEYEAEMEILRWTGQPSMALINPIENQNHVAAWDQALHQFFKLVRVFDAVQADTDKQLSLLEAFAHLHPPWAETLARLIHALRDELSRQDHQSAWVVSELLADLCEYQLTQKVLDKSQAKLMQPLLEKRYYQWMRRRELRALDELQQLFRHHQLERSATALELPADLFDTGQWYAWGLDRQQLATVAAIGGAAAGVAIDIGLAGHSLMLGALSGGLAGGSAAWFGADKLANSKLKGLPMGGYEARMGPIGSKNFPYVVLGRFLFMHQALKHRNHARRDRLELQEGELNKQLEALPMAERKAIYVALDRLSRQKEVDNLVDLLVPLFRQQ